MVIDQVHSLEAPFPCVYSLYLFIQTLSFVYIRRDRRPVNHRPPEPSIQSFSTTALIALANNKTLQTMNDGLVKTSKEHRQKKTKKRFGTARLLIVEDTLRIREDGALKEQC